MTEVVVDREEAAPVASPTRTRKTAAKKTASRRTTTPPADETPEQTIARLKAEVAAKEAEQNKLKKDVAALYKKAKRANQWCDNGSLHVASGLHELGIEIPTPPLTTVANIPISGVTPADFESGTPDTGGYTMTSFHNALAVALNEFLVANPITLNFEVTRRGLTATRTITLGGTSLARSNQSAGYRVTPASS